VFQSHWLKYSITSLREQIQTLISALLMRILLLYFLKPCRSEFFPAVIQLQKDSMNVSLDCIANSITLGAFSGNVKSRLDSLSLLHSRPDRGGWVPNRKKLLDME